MYAQMTSESEQDIIDWMNLKEKEGYKFISSNTYSKFGFCGLCVIMYRGD